MGLAEAPGQAEDEDGLPFRGAAGRKLDELLAEVPLRREDIWLDNRVHCRPPRNDLRAYPNALTVCTDSWLDKVIDSVRPKVIVCLGKTAADIWFPGLKVYEQQELQRVLPNGIVVIGSRHPSAVLHGDQKAAAAIVASFRRAKELVE